LNRLQRNGDAADGVDSAGAAARSARVDPHAPWVLVAQRTRLKNRLSATLAKYGTPASEYSDPYGKRGRAELEKHLQGLPEQTRWVSWAVAGTVGFCGQPGAANWSSGWPSWWK